MNTEKVMQNSSETIEYKKYSWPISIFILRSKTYIDWRFLYTFQVCLHISTYLSWITLLEHPKPLIYHSTFSIKLHEINGQNPTASVSPLLSSCSADWTSTLTGPRKTLFHFWSTINLSCWLSLLYFLLSLFLGLPSSQNPFLNMSSMFCSSLCLYFSFLWEWLLLLSTFKLFLKKEQNPHPLQKTISHVSNSKEPVVHIGIDNISPTVLWTHLTSHNKL